MLEIHFIINHINSKHTHLIFFYLTFRFNASKVKINSVILLLRMQQGTCIDDISGISFNILFPIIKGRMISSKQQNTLYHQIYLNPFAASKIAIKFSLNSRSINKLLFDTFVCFWQKDVVSFWNETVYSLISFLLKYCQLVSIWCFNSIVLIHLFQQLSCWKFSKLKLNWNCWQLKQT